MTQTTEKAFESFVETILQQQGGWQPGTNAEWDVERALFPARVFAFLEATQPKLWEEMRKLHAAGLENLLVAALVKELDLKGAYLKFCVGGHIIVDKGEMNDRQHQSLQAPAAQI